MTSVLFVELYAYYGVLGKKNVIAVRGADTRLHSLGIAAKRISKVLMSVDFTQFTYSAVRVLNIGKCKRDQKKKVEKSR